MLIQPTVERLRALRLKGMAEAFLAQLQQADLLGTAFEDRFGLLVDQEWVYRRNRRLARLLKEARLRLPACLEDIDYQHPRGLDRSVMHGLASCHWVTAHQNILISGPTGVGKTFIACALAQAACRHEHRTRYYRLPRLLTDLAASRGDGSYPRLLGSLARTQVLALDDWGISPLTAADCRDLLEIIDDRSQTWPTIIASQLPIDQWHSYITDPTVADAILDRLVHGAHKLQLKGESMRKVSMKPPEPAETGV